MSGHQRWTVGVYGAGIGMLAHVAPGWADRALARRFCTPMRRSIRPSGASFGAEGAVRQGDRLLPVWRGGAGPRVLLAHGWDGQGAFWDPMAAALIAAGYEAVTFDMPAHGSAGGSRTHVFDMVGAVREVARAVGPVSAIVGHSAGAVAGAIALGEGLEADRAVLIAAPVRPASFMFALTDSLGLGPERAWGALEVMGREIGRDPFDADTLAAVRPLGIPGLVVHDADDARAPWRDGYSITRAWSGARLLSTRGLGHYRLPRDPEVIGAVVAFLDEGAAPARRKA